MPLTSPGNDDDTGENHQPTLRKNTAEPAQQTLKQYKPPVAIRRWTRDDGYDDCEFLPKEGVYGPACKLHANHDVVPLAVILDVMLGDRR